VAKHNYRTGAYVSPFAWDKNRVESKHWNITRSPLSSAQMLRGTLDWDSLENVQGHIKDLKTIRKISASKERYFADNPDKDTLIGSLHGTDKPNYSINMFYGQGLGPENFDKLYKSEQHAVQSQWWEASERKFLLREEALKGIAAAGGEEAYAAQQTAREELGKPFAEGARAAELLRQDRGPRTGGGAALRGAGRQASRARVAEGRRLASRDRTTGSGGGGPRRLRAANLLRQPLGAGSQSSAQVLG
jgi:hypothetical protein